MAYLGLDIGTSACKAVVYAGNGKRLALARREYDIHYTSDGGAELNPEEVVAKCFEAIRECSARVAPRPVYAMGVSSQGEAFTAIDRQGEALCNAMVSADSRSAPYVEPWEQQFGADRLYQITGHTPHPLFTLFKLLWLKDNRPEIWRKAVKFLCFEDFFHQKLGLRPVISYSLAGRTLLFDVRNQIWDREILAAAGLTGEQLATPMASGSLVGKLSKQMSAKLGLAEGAAVVAGGHDQTCGALGAGIVKAGMAMYATGTVECITPVFDKPVFSQELLANNLCTYNHAVKNMYATLAYSLTGGNILKWFRDELGQKEVEQAQKSGKSAYALLLDAMPEEPSGLLVLPYFTPSGTPYFDTTTKGAILGLRLNTSRGEIIKALLEGVAFEMRLNLEILARAGCRIDELRAMGGGAKSAVWTQLKADVTGKNIIVLDVVEAGCMGVAMLACAWHTGRAIESLAAQWVKPVATVRPQAGHAAFYNKRFRQYKKLYPVVKQINIP